MKSWKALNLGILLALSCQCVAVEFSDPGVLLDKLSKKSEDNASLGEGILRRTPEYRAALEQGPLVLPALIARLASSESPETEMLLLLFHDITRIGYFLYSSEPLVLNSFDLQEKDLEALPTLSRPLGSADRGNQRNEREEILRWWAQLNRTYSWTERLNVLQGHCDYLRVGFTPEKWRACHKATVNFGIFDIPAWAHVVVRFNDPVALLRFLIATRHPAFVELARPEEPEECLKLVKEKWPSHEARVALIETWWSENRALYAALPALADGIDSALVR